MKKARFTEDQIGVILNEQEAGLAVARMPDVERREFFNK